MQAMQDYRACLANFELVPIKAADPRVVDSLYRRDWVRLGVGLTDNPALEHRFATALTLLTLLYFSLGAVTHGPEQALIKIKIIFIYN